MYVIILVTKVLFKWNYTQTAQKLVGDRSSNPVPLPDLYFDSFSYPVASIVFGDMAIVSLFLLLFNSQSQILSGMVQTSSGDRFVDKNNIVSNTNFTFVHRCSQRLHTLKNVLEDFLE